MSKRDEYIARMQAQLDEWSAELHRLEARAAHVESSVGEKYRHTIAELHDRKVAAEMKLEGLRHAGEDVWEDLKEEAERTWTAFKAGLDVLRDFSDHA